MTVCGKVKGKGRELSLSISKFWLLLLLLQYVNGRMEVDNEKLVTISSGCFLFPSAAQLGRKQERKPVF